MWTAIIGGFIIAAIVCLLVAARRRHRQGKPQHTVFYACTRCERPYAIPDVPLRCRQCGGNVEKMDMPPEREK